jgi:hypothetical protein
MTGQQPLVALDERSHPVDPAVWSWNESWFSSFVDHDGGPAGFFRLGALPNQGRAMLWSFVHVGDEWLGVEEARLTFDHLDLTEGLGYDRWALRFGWRPDPPLAGARFSFDGDALVRSGPGAGAHRHVVIDLACTATGDAVRTGSGRDEALSTHEISRFEQPLEVRGSVVVDGVRHEVRGGGHRDRSWGPREWRQAFTLGDLQAPGHQLYFVGRSGLEVGMGFERDGAEVRHGAVSGEVDFDDEHRTIVGARIRLDAGGAPPLEATLRPLAPSIAFDMAHTAEVPERWLYWRTLVEADVPGWGAPCRGWFESCRWGLAPPTVSPG